MEDRIQQKIGREDSKEGKGKTYLGEKEGTGVGKQNNCREEQREEDEWDWDFFGPEPNLEDYFGGMKLHEKEKEDLYFSEEVEEYDGFTDVEDYTLDKIPVWARVKVQ